MHKFKFELVLFCYIKTNDSKLMFLSRESFFANP